jgi:hypothetical protein
VPNEETPWVVKGVSDYTRQLVKMYAAANNMKMAEALQLLVSRGVAAGLRPTNNSAQGVLRDMPDEVFEQLIKRVAEETERRHSLSPEQQQAEEAGRLRSLRQSQPTPSQAKPSDGDVDLQDLMRQFVRRGEDES